MKRNDTYYALLSKSTHSMLAAIEVYNKPNFAYREETFSILAINSWELLFKAFLFKKNKYNLRSICILEKCKNKNGKDGKRTKIKLNRSNNPQTISIIDIMRKLKGQGYLPENLYSNIESLIELRDNSIHFISNQIPEVIQSLSLACVKNYITIIHKWELEIDLSQYNFHLMPLAYINKNIVVDSVITSNTSNYLNFLKSKIKNDQNQEDYDVAISVGFTFSKVDAGSIDVKNSPSGIPVAIKVDDKQFKEKFPLTYSQVVSKANKRYLDFVQNKVFHQLMIDIKQNTKISFERKLDPEKDKGGKFFYNNNIWQVLDKKYTKKK